MAAAPDRYRREDNVVGYTRPGSAPARERLQPSAERRLHIAVLAPPWIPVSPPGYGGIESVVALLCDALVELKHAVELFCAPGSHSRATVQPIRWPEPFGMVMVEAMAAGTPVLAFPEGAAPELVEHGISGFLVADEDEMAKMVPEAGRLDPLQVRRSAECFAPDRVAAAYEQAYRAALRGVAA